VTPVPATAKPALATDPARSALMARVRQNGTRPELLVRVVLRRLRVAYRTGGNGLPGRPDLSNKARSWAIFVNGCFWHHHTACARATTPSRNHEYWVAKFVANRRRDATAIRRLRAMGYDVFLIWECRVEGAELVHLLDRFFSQRRNGSA
jgi:DNA mismatch endonuclease (patch repair protein)